MYGNHVLKISKELGLRAIQVNAVALLLDERATVPFIARYRKEATGSLDEVAITSIRDRLEDMRKLDERRQSIIKSLQERGVLTIELKESLEAAENMATLEDIYLPLRPKRRTRASIARERGLQPLADLLMTQTVCDVLAEAALYVDAEKGVPSSEDALQGARDIIAESISEDQKARAQMRNLFNDKATLRSKVVKGKEEDGIKYRDYFDWEEPVKGSPSHRVLAMRRGETEGFLSLRVLPDEKEALGILEPLFVKGQVLSQSSEQVSMAVSDGYKRLLAPSMETEIRMESKNRCDKTAIGVFADNLRQLLLAPPLGQKRVLAIDPGFRTGCKVVCLDEQGKLLHRDTVYPHHLGSGGGRAADAPPAAGTLAETPQRSEGFVKKASDKIIDLVSKYGIEAIAIGNGTAGRETEAFVRSLSLPADVAVIMVNESGASVYSACDAAREEFPDEDVTVRGAVSIGRRLKDPLAELVKIPPQSIGVGQYQHDVNQSALQRSLDDVVVTCVNAVGVELNTASKELLTYVSGIGESLAKNIVGFRDANGPYVSRKDLLKVPKLGPKAFEQSAGFLRIRSGKNPNQPGLVVGAKSNPLDASAVHPESYHVVDAMAGDVGCTVEDLMRDENLRNKIELSRYVGALIGMPTLTDIMKELAKPGRDPRESFEIVRFEDGINKIEDVKPGMKLTGIVTNVTAFGAFVDVGVHQDGLVHVSQLSDRYVKNPSDVVKVGQKVTVTVVEVDEKRKRISLSMKGPVTPKGQAIPAKAAVPVKGPASPAKGSGSV
ncbi:MAG: RNA-binding transcriptional accessory protein [Nitrospirae bacterium]|nr:RNA-binding transcriptional accessory protein [Nitrospirota bacterium]